MDNFSNSKLSGPNINENTQEKFEAAVAERLEVQNAISHWKRKLDGEQAKVNAAEEDFNAKKIDLQVIFCSDFAV
jgi:hypothetical protein